MPLTLLFPKSKVRVGLVNFDATISESHRKANEVTSHPVEAGVDVSDHIRPQPEEIDINGIVSDTPLVYLPSLRATSPIEGDLTRPTERADAAYKELQRVMDSGQLVTVVTKLREYESMAITIFGVDRDASTGNVLNATLSLRQVVTVESQVTAEPIPVASGNKKSKRLGKVVPKEADAATTEKSKSLLDSAVGFVRGAVGGG